VHAAALSSGLGSATAGPVLVSGHVGLFGGPLNPKTGRMALNGSPAAQMRVTAVSKTRKVAATTGRDGRFVLHLPPGNYLIKSECGVGKHLAVHGQRPVHIDLQCDVP
jgi:hypothetical protein